MYNTENNGNDGRFPDDCLVQVRYLRSKQEENGDRAQWPWLPGEIVRQCGPDEWLVCVTEHEVARLRNGRRAPRGTSPLKLYYPLCYRDASEIRPRSKRLTGTGTDQGVLGALASRTVRRDPRPGRLLHRARRDDRGRNR